ncbi:MAG: hypothetical protein U9Q03_04510 [Patescibacteria group bacterium]|nr:hypothetical protein [Patescibacteria group bacterium]
MEKEQESNPLSNVLCEKCLTNRSGITMIGHCEKCGGLTNSATLKFCAKCATEDGVCSMCGEPLDKKD